MLIQGLWLVGVYLYLMYEHYFYREIKQISKICYMCIHLSHVTMAQIDLKGGLIMSFLYHRTDICSAKIVYILGGGNSNIFYVHPENWGR